MFELLEMKNKRISIVTISFANFEDLSKSIKSVLIQNVFPYEYIIVASGYNESEKKMIDSLTCKHNCIRLVFDRDKSIYNAMNIGIAEASGDFIFFLNAGDVFLDEFSLSFGSSKIKNRRCYAFRVQQVFENDIYIRPGIDNISDLNFKPPHQGFFSPLEEAISERVYFKENLYISADVEWMNDSINRYGIQVCEEILCRFMLGGVSNNPSLKTVFLRFRERRGVYREIFKFIIKKIVGNQSYYKIFAKIRGYDHLLF